MPGNYNPSTEYVVEFLDNQAGEFETNHIRYFLSTKPGRAPTNAINNMLIDLSPKYVEPVKYQGANHIWKPQDDTDLDQLEKDLKPSYSNSNLTSTKFRSKI